MKAQLLVMIFFLGCNQNTDYFDENNYSVIKIDSTGSIINSRILENKYDHSRKIIILYWDNKKIMTKSFFKGNIKDGTDESFYISGDLLSSEFYRNGVKEGSQKTYYPNGKLKRIEMYNNGVIDTIERFDSLGNKMQ